MAISTKLEHPIKAPSPIEVTLFEMAISVKLEQPLKALFPMEVTLFGIVISDKNVQFEKAQADTLLTPCCI